MCRNIKTLFNFNPPPTEKEIHEASLQFVRKLTGFQKPSKENEIAFNNAINEITQTTKTLLNSLKTKQKSKNREVEAQKARERNTKRFPTSSRRNNGL